MSREISIRRLRTGSVYKLFLIGSLAFFVPLGALAGVCALFGAHTLTWNGAAVTGVSGLLAGPFIGLFIACIFTLLFGTATALGLRLYALVRSLRLTVID